jgi:hypothetical protein
VKLCDRHRNTDLNSCPKYRHSAYARSQVGATKSAVARFVCEPTHSAETALMFWGGFAPFEMSITNVRKNPMGLLLPSGLS